MKKHVGIAGMRKVFCHRYTEYGKVAFNTWLRLIEQKVVLPFSFDEILAYVRPETKIRAVVFRSRNITLSIFMQQSESTWYVHLVELSTQDGEKYFIPNGGGRWVQEDGSKPVALIAFGDLESNMVFADPAFSQFCIRLDPADSAYATVFEKEGGRWIETAAWRQGFKPEDIVYLIETCSPDRIILHNFAEKMRSAITLI
jgi:hypothetical protein